MRKNTLALLIALFVIAPLAFAADDAGTQITRPAGYKPMSGDARLGEELFNDVKLSSNGMSCAGCHANHGAYRASFATPYPHTVAMAQDQMGRKTVYLDEMIQACMVIPMAARTLPWNSKELAGLVAYLQNQQKSFKPSR